MVNNLSMVFCISILHHLQEVQIGGWTLARKVGTNETVFKFHRTLKVDGGAMVTVWSSDLGQTHEPPSTIVMKGQKWFCGDNMTTQLYNADGEVMCALCTVAICLRR